MKCTANAGGPHIGDYYLRRDHFESFINCKSFINYLLAIAIKRRLADRRWTGYHRDTALHQVTPRAERKSEFLSLCRSAGTAGSDGKPCAIRWEFFFRPMGNPVGDPVPSDGNPEPSDANPEPSDGKPYAVRWETLCRQMRNPVPSGGKPSVVRWETLSNKAGTSCHQKRKPRATRKKPCAVRHGNPVQHKLKPLCHQMQNLVPSDGKPTSVWLNMHRVEGVARIPFSSTGSG